LRAAKIPMPDPSKRADVVLSKPRGYPNMSGGVGAHSAGAGSTIQSSEEALNSLVQEMKEILDAPVYKDTPLPDVAKRFWSALQDNQKISSKNEERLEQNLGKLKGDFLLARAVSLFRKDLTDLHIHISNGNISLTYHPSLLNWIASKKGMGRKTQLGSTTS
jgi:hypothetical protein